MGGRDRACKHGVKDVRLAGLSVELLFGERIVPVHSRLDDPEGAGFEAIVAGGEGLAERQCLSAV